MAEIVSLFPDLPREDGSTGPLAEAARIAEALLFAAAAPMPEAEIARRLPAGVDPAAVLARLKEDYSKRGVQLVRAGALWAFRTADDLGWALSASGRETRKLSRAAMETLAIIAYHQPTTRAEVEEIRGVAVAKGTLDVLLETGWIRPRGRRRSPGRPVTYGTTDGFLLHFGLESTADLPGLDELRGAGFFDERATAPVLGAGPLAIEDLLEDPLEDPLDAADAGEVGDDLDPDTDRELEPADDPLDPEPPDSLDRDPFA